MLTPAVLKRICGGLPNTFSTSSAAAAYAARSVISSLMAWTGAFFSRKYASRLVQMILADVRDHDFASGLGEHLCLPESRPGSAARDEQDLVFEVLHQCLLNLVH